MSNEPIAPWSFSDHCRSPWRLLDSEGECIAMVYMTDEKTRRRDAKHASYAQLMVSAPRVLAALTALLAEVDETTSRNGWAGNGARDLARAAIAEATTAA